ncbi:protoporphyrinogen oxidase [Scaptodrosophila lebanonensis]|uniref:Protoporphyrinogen oxidase n=1 Tax=Drosophila lebanonensis TaxID=7225 RepID=A0A6J2TLW8_DROLE|nr:protoporphyrinogen oxidase [Scaptodrosophila lebanonensis]
MASLSTAVLGGGISGLSAGYYLLRQFGKPLTIYESSPRVGGWIRTEKHRDRSFIFESGPRTIRPKGLAGANTLELVEQLKVPIKPILSSHVAARNRMIYAKGELCMLPNSPKGLFSTLPPFTQPLYKALWHDLITGSTPAKHDDESIYSFAERRFGKEIADYAISPMICGICAGDAREISVRFLMESLFEKEQKYGGVLKGVLYSRFSGGAKKDSAGLFAQSQPALYSQACQEKWAMYGVEDGLEQLPRALRKYLGEHDVNVQLSTECRSLSFNNNGVRLQLRDAEVPVEHVVSSLPAYKMAQLVKTQHPSLAAQLQAIPYVDVVVVNMQYDSDELLQREGFGLLVPPVEKLPLLGIIFDSCCFEMAGNTVLTVMMGGHWFNQWFGNRPTQKQLLDIAVEYVRKILDIKEAPKFSRVHTLHQCIPQYTVGHKQRVEGIRRYIKTYKLPLSVCGAAYDGVGINDVILSARRQVEALQPVSTA